MDRCRIDYIPSQSGKGPWANQGNNNRGNVMEYLAWLALEQDRCDILVAMCEHYDNMEASEARGNPIAERIPEVVPARGNPIATGDQADLEHHTRPYSDA